MQVISVGGAMLLRNYHYRAYESHSWRISSTVQITCDMRVGRDGLCIWKAIAALSYLMHQRCAAYAYAAQPEDGNSLLSLCQLMQYYFSWNVIAYYTWKSWFARMRTLHEHTLCLPSCSVFHLCVRRMKLLLQQKWFSSSTLRCASGAPESIVDLGELKQFSQTVPADFVWIKLFMYTETYHTQTHKIHHIVSEYCPCSRRIENSLAWIWVLTEIFLSS